ncbi:MAG: cytochrome b [Rickettsiales bacterium]|nr:cytochrome b [Rickettsiales bacterium]
MAALILTLIALGIYMTGLSKEDPSRMEVYNLHKSLGALALIFVFIRLVNRVIKPAPKLPDTIVKSEKILAHLAHIGLYILMVIVPLSGYLMSNYFGYPVQLFGIKMPTLVQTNVDLGKIFHETHEISPYILLGLIILHVIGVVKHRFFDKPENDVLKRML